MRISPQIAGLYIRYRRDASTTHESYLASLLDGQRYRSVAQPDAIVSVSLGLNYHDYPIPMHHRFVGHHFPHLSQDTRDHVLSLAAASQEPVAQQPTYEWPEDLFESEDEDPARLLSAREAAREVVREERNSRQDFPLLQTLSRRRRTENWQRREQRRELRRERRRAELRPCGL